MEISIKIKFNRENLKRECNQKIIILVALQYCIYSIFYDWYKSLFQLTGNLKVVFCLAYFVDSVACISSFIMSRHNFVNGKYVFPSDLGNVNALL